MQEKCIKEASARDRGPDDVSLGGSECVSDADALDKLYMEAALAQARRAAEAGEVPIGAVVVKLSPRHAIIAKPTTILRRMRNFRPWCKLRVSLSAGGCRIARCM